MFLVVLILYFAVVAHSSDQPLNDHHEKNILKPSQQCNSRCNINLNSSYFNFKESLSDVTKFMGMGVNMALVSQPRKKATYILLRAALMTCQIGDIVETGVFTGGSSAVILKTLIELDDCNRKFWVFDSFEGLPEISDKDKSTDGKFPFKASEELFISNLKSVGVWDESKILISKGWFNTTVPVAPIMSIAFLRLDGDLYVSTKDAIEGLYPKLMKGGYIYIDDYSAFVGCKTAIDEYRTKHSITEKIHEIFELNGSVEAVWWRKE